MPSPDLYPTPSSDARIYVAAAHWLPAMLRFCRRETKQWALQARAAAAQAGRRAKALRPHRPRVVRVVSTRTFRPWGNSSAASSRVLVAQSEKRDANARRSSLEDYGGPDPGMLIIDDEILWLSWVDEKLRPVHVEVVNK